ncbi:predicted protein [Chaetomium globosum CBS 148.51]|uniref:Uncharacterized protein n=1 Tax=Chaetomium globosum (strain ATCC 6205 / CBS 148.51 / DSM 1962 / NBRC 6347 / NRRL 1970) TaxID=306901 RepID=Q2H413_CHAGB|nr:uncharacterized protein CHGG_06602 [Chaetomium globosum CBS 148.51]EAQ89983.1 predicted protein [Chaetomium globosum CBS 148.51]
MASRLTPQSVFVTPNSPTNDPNGNAQRTQHQVRICDVLPTSCLKPAEPGYTQNLAGDRIVAFLGMPGAQQGGRCQGLGVGRQDGQGDDKPTNQQAPGLNKLTGARSPQAVAGPVPARGMRQVSSAWVYQLFLADALSDILSAEPGAGRLGSTRANNRAPTSIPFRVQDS